MVSPESFSLLESMEMCVREAERSTELVSVAIHARHECKQECNNEVSSQACNVVPRLHRSSVLASFNKDSGEHSSMDALSIRRNARSTPLWRMEMIVWLNLLELMFQCWMDFFMWHYSHPNRPCLVEFLNALFGVIYMSRDVTYELEKYNITKNGK